MRSFRLPLWWYSIFFFFSSRRRHTRCLSDWSSDVCSSDLGSPDRLNNLRTRDALVGEPFWDTAINKAVLVLVVPIRQDNGVFLGALGAKINLDSLKDMLDGLSAGHTRSLYLITEQGRVVISSAGNSADVMKTTLPDATTRELNEREGQTVVQSRPQGREVVAVLRRIPQLRWAAVAETPRAETLREAGGVPVRTLLLFTFLLPAGGGLGVLGWGLFPPPPP